jgi:hypothetical protein
MSLDTNIQEENKGKIALSMFKEMVAERNKYLREASSYGI